MPRLFDVAPHMSDIGADHARSARQSAGSEPLLSLTATQVQLGPERSLKSAGQVFALYRFESGPENKVALHASGLQGDLLSLIVGDVVQVHHKVIALQIGTPTAPLISEDAPQGRKKLARPPLDAPPLAPPSAARIRVVVGVQNRGEEWVVRSVLHHGDKFPAVRAQRAAAASRPIQKTGAAVGS